MLLTLGAGYIRVAPSRAASGVPATRPLVVLLSHHVARAARSVNARRIETVSARRPLTNVRTVLPVLGCATSGGGRLWAHVDRLAHLGQFSTRLVIIYRGGLVERRFRAVLGKRSTPTPRGRFFVEEAVALKSSRDSGGPFAPAASARSNVLQQFEGGPGQIALHGTNRLRDASGPLCRTGASGSAHMPSPGWPDVSAPEHR